MPGMVDLALGHSHGKSGSADLKMAMVMLMAKERSC